MSVFELKYEEWMQTNISQEKNPRRRELLEKGLSHGTVEFLRSGWFPAVRNFNDLYPEWEVRDFHNGYRYLDLAYMPGGAKGGIEIQDFGSHARDIDARRFKDLCWRHSLLTMDDWRFLLIAYLSIRDEPERCRQLVLSFIGKFISTDVPSGLSCLEAETIRYARRLMRPFSANDLAEHLRGSEQHARRLLNRLADRDLLFVASGNKRYRLYCMRTDK